MMKSFRDPVTNVLKAYGFVDANTPGDISRSEAGDFSLEPGKWRLVNDVWVAHTPVIVPQSVPIRKAKALLIDRDKIELVHNHIMALPGKAGKKAQNEWIESSVVERYRPLTLQMFALIGVNDEAERDQWFIDANALP
jgi:hypothetical protein